MDRLASGLPPWMVSTWVGAFGLVLGSFLNVVVHRVPRGLSIVHPRSACPACGRFIPWHENLPVLSWLLLRGRCRGCQSRISPRYVAVEMLTAGLLVGAHLRFGLGLAFGAAALFVLVVTALVFIDAEHMLLPDVLTLPGAFAGLALSPWAPLASAEDALLGVLLAVFVLESLNLAYRLLRGRDGFGAGDTKMLALIGAFLGWKLMILTLVLASFGGALVGIPALAASRWLGRGAAPEPEPEPGPAAEPDAGSDAEGPQPGPLAGLLPRTAAEALGPLTFLVLALAFLPDGSPGRAVLGLVAGIALAVLQHALGRPGSRLRSTAAQWPLAGAVAGLSPTLRLAGAVLALLAIAAAWRSVPAAEEPGVEEDLPSAPASLMQAALPFGVFLGAAALTALFFGEGLVSWYADAAGLAAGWASP